MRKPDKRLHASDREERDRPRAFSRESAGEIEAMQMRGPNEGPKGSFVGLPVHPPERPSRRSAGPRDPRVALGPPTPLSDSQGALQRITSERLAEIADKTQANLGRAPTKGMNLWEAILDNGESLFLLGTAHANKLYQMQQAGELVDFLDGTNFRSVLTEVEGEAVKFETPAGFLKQASELERLSPGVNNADKARLTRRASAAFDEVSTGVDEAYSRLAVGGDVGAKTGHLETKEGIRAKAKEQNREDLGQQTEVRFGGEDTDQIQKAHARGQEQFIWQKQIESLREGRDIQDVEERNDRWVNTQVAGLLGYQGDGPLLWIVGASHVPGLIVRLEEAGLKFASKGGVIEEEPEALPPYVANVMYRK